MSEASSMLEVPSSTVRFWADSFPKHVKPMRNAKGNRMFHPEDIETLKQIKYLLKDRGLTLDGALKELSHGGSSADRIAKAMDCLKEIRVQLLEVKHSL